MYIYLAGPFFKPHEVEAISKIEKELTDKEILFYSPRWEGVLITQSEEEKQANKKRIYDRNVEMISGASKVLAIIDDRDIGTIWEMGFATGLKIPVITISSQSYGLNVMLAESVQAHVLNINDAIEAILNNSFKGELLKGVF